MTTLAMRFDLWELRPKQSAQLGWPGSSTHADNIRMLTDVIFFFFWNLENIFLIKLVRHVIYFSESIEAKKWKQ